jgi:hypothetical protein
MSRKSSKRGVSAKSGKSSNKSDHNKKSKIDVVVQTNDQDFFDFQGNFEIL